jgi:ABC-type nitrate/sulfonate/bicarbonate transport system permease component
MMHGQRPSPAAPVVTVDAAPSAVVPAASRRHWPLWAPSVDPLGIIGLLLFVGAWWLVSVFADPTAIPSPLIVVQRMMDDFWDARELRFYALPNVSFSNSMVYTAGNVLLATAVGSAIGTITGLATAKFKLVRSVLDPIAMTAGTIPILVLAPFFLIWFGTERPSAVALVAFYVVVILYIFAQRAAENIDPVFEDGARVLGATEVRIVRDVLIPGALPEILGGIRIALAGAWGLEAISELLGAQRGMGRIIKVLAGTTDIQGIMAALLLLGLVAVVFDAMTALLFAWLTRWRRSATTQAGG